MNPPPAPAGRLAALGLLTLAAAPRLWGIDYGLPWLFYFHDEPQVVLRALRFGTGDFNPHFFIWPGILLLHLAFVSYAALFAVGLALGWWSGAGSFAAAYFRDPSVFYLLPRLHSVAFGVWGVWLTLALGRAAYAGGAAAAAAVTVALHALHVHYSHFAHPVTAMTAFTLLALWAAVRLATTRAARPLWVGAVATALGVACQYHAALAAVPLAVAVGYRAAEDGRIGGAAAAARWLGRAAAAAALAGALFLALSPYTLIDHATFRADLAWITTKTAGQAPGLAAGVAAFLQGCLAPALGAPLAVATAAGAAWAAVRRRRADVILLAYVAAYAVLAGRAGVLNDRYAIPVIAPLLLLAARAIDDACAAGGLRGRVRQAAPTVTMLVLSLPVVVDTVETQYTMTREDTRVAAMRWFESRVPADERVVIDMLRFWNTASPPLAENRERVEERLAEVGTGVAGAGHSGVYAEYYRYRLDHPQSPAYYLRGTEMGRAARPPADYRREGFRWVVVSEEAVALQRAAAARGQPNTLAHYRALDDEAELVAEFAPQRWRRRGPEIRIYRLAVGGREGDD